MNRLLIYFILFLCFRSPIVAQKETSTADYIGFYQKYVSGIRGQHCPMYPSCSNFGLLAFSTSSFASGFIQTADRLTRCGHEQIYYPITMQENGVRYIDFPNGEIPPKELYYTSNKKYFAYSDTLEDETSIALIKKLINEHLYQEALIEVFRTEITSNEFNLELFINKLITYKALEKYENALFEYEIKCPEHHKNDANIVYQLAQIHYLLEQHELASQTTESILQRKVEEEFLKHNFITLNALSKAHLHQWEASKKQFILLKEFEPYARIADNNIVILDRAFELKDKNPTIASLISIIPGLGYAYTGHKQTAVSAFVLNGLLAYATYTSIKNENYGIAVLTGVFNMSFYIGNIYGANKSAKRYNLKSRNDIIKKLEFNTTIY